MTSALGPKESEPKSHPYKYSSSCSRSPSKKQDQIFSIIFLSGFRNTFWKCQTNAFYTWDKKTIRKHAAQNVSGLLFSLLKYNKTLFKGLTRTYRKVICCWGSQSSKQVSYYIILAIEAVVSCKCHVGGVWQANPSYTNSTISTVSTLHLVTIYKYTIFILSMLVWGIPHS